jgi:aromatic ring-cleaving dioxygenase
MEYVTHLSENPEAATKSKYGLSFTHPVQYYDFHVYYYARIEESRAEADQLRAALLAAFPHECAEGAIIVKKLPDDRVIGPHITQFWEADVKRPEVFVLVLSWFQLHHGALLVLIHPQTGDDLADHTDRALWLGARLPVITSVFGPRGEVPEFGVRRAATLASTGERSESSESQREPERAKESQGEPRRAKES